MFHDTQERERDFVVWRLWKEIEGAYPSFEFEHGHGLGLLLVGDNPPAPIRALLTCQALAKQNLGKPSPIRASPEAGEG